MTDNNPLRNEIIGHIEASGELACWIVPYLYHAAYQTVRDLERDGTLVIEVGKRGEPVYVFAPTPPAPAPAPTDDDKMRDTLRMIESHMGSDAPAIVVDREAGTSEKTTIGALTAQPPVASTAASAAPKLKLTKHRHEILARIKSYNDNGKVAGEFHLTASELKAARELKAAGYIERGKYANQVGLVITDAGRAALKASGR